MLVISEFEIVFIAKGEDVRRIVEQDYHFAERIRDWIGTMLYRIKNRFGHMDGAKQLQADLEQALREYRLALANVKGMYNGASSNASNSFYAGESNKIVDLSSDNKLSNRIKGLKGSEKYKAIRDYILEALDDSVVFGDGIEAKVDKSDASHLAHKAGHVKVSYFSKIKEIIDNAILFSTKDDVDHNKFDAFRYYQAVVRLGEDEYPIYLNVGHAKNGDGYHLYDITKRVGEVEKQTSVFERVNDLRSKNDLPTDSRVPHPDSTVKNRFSFSSPKFETAPADATQVYAERINVEKNFNNKK